jgi:hypothetical protein
MEAVEGEDHHHDEVRNQEADVESVPAVLAAKSVIGVVSLPVMRQPMLVGKEER